MTKKVERPKSIILTEKQAKLVEATLDNKSPIDAAAIAGYSNPVASAGTALKTVAVQKALAEARSELSSAAQIKRADVIDGFMEAINMARLTADPATMIKGWTEVGKMLGHYAPEVKRIDLSMGQKRLQDKFVSMSDEDLLRVIEGEVLDVTVETIQ